MSDLLLWDKPGVGPVLKVMAGDADPFTTPNDEYGKFRFNSETADLGYIHFGPRFSWDEVKWPSPGVDNTRNVYYWPDGTDASDCHAMMVVYRQYAGAIYRTAIYLWSRILGIDWPPIVEAYSGGAKPLAGRSWQETVSPYGGPGGQLVSVGPNSDVAPVHHQQAGEEWPTTFGSVGSGIFPALVSAYTGYYSILRLYSGSPETGHRAWLLPANDMPLPFQSETPLNDQHVVEFSPSLARMARPGFDVRTMTRFQSIFSETMSPAKIVGTGLVTVAASASVTLTFDYALQDGTYVDAIATRAGETYGYLPPMDTAMTNLASPVAGMTWGVEYEIVGNEITISNNGWVDVDVRYIVLADDGSEPTSGTGDVLFWGEDYQQIRRPGASSDPSHADILLDTRWACLPIITDGWIPFASFADTPTADNERWINGTKKASVSWSNDGSWVPFIKCAFVYHGGVIQGGNATTIQTFAGARAIEVSPNPIDDYTAYLTAVVESSRSPEDRTTPQTRRSAICRFTDSSADFYLSPEMSDLYHFNNGPSDTRPRWRNQNGGGTIGTFGPIVGIRYYVFAIPKPEAL